jgi:hypothetical protein
VVHHGLIPPLEGSSYGSDWLLFARDLKVS